MSGHHVIKKNRKDFSKVSLFRITRRGTRMGPNGQRYSKFFSEKNDSLFGQHCFTGQADQIDMTLKD